jgi:tryptophan synthase alpha chain
MPHAREPSVALPGNRLVGSLTRMRASNEKALALFLTAGYPRRESTRELVPVLAAAGADLIEIGMPFSDPLADGPVIQQSSAVSIANGTTLSGILEDLRAIRRASSVPVVLMGYMNPILSYGAERFFADAALAGADGVILPELPLEESGRFGALIAACGLAQILLVTPTTPDERIVAIDNASTGFLYCVATTGVTGAGGGDVARGYLNRVRKHASRNPVLVGFGIAGAEDAQRVVRDADGVIIGSALIRKLAVGEAMGRIAGWVGEIKAAMGA